MQSSNYYNQYQQLYELNPQRSYNTTGVPNTNTNNTTATATATDNTTITAITATATSQPLIVQTKEEPLLQVSMNAIDQASSFDDQEDDDNNDLDESINDEIKKPARRAGRRKIEIRYIEDKTRRHITFSKRKAGIMKKAYELATLTGTQLLLLVVSESGLVYTFTTQKLQPIVTSPKGKALIQESLNAEGFEDSEDNPQITQ